MRWLFSTALLCFAALLFAPAAPASEQPTIYPLRQGTHANSLVAGPEGAIWFAGGHEDVHGPFEGTGPLEAVVGRVLANGESRELPLPSVVLRAWRIAAGGDGNLWFAYEGRTPHVPRIGRITPGGEFTGLRLGRHIGFVRSLAPGPGGGMWFTATYWIGGRQYGEVGRISLRGDIKRFTLGPDTHPAAIVTGPDTNLWFIDEARRAPAIVRLTPAGNVTRFPLPSRQWIPRSIIAGPDHRLWFGTISASGSPGQSNRIGRISVTGKMKLFSVPGTRGTRALAAGPGKAVSFTTEMKSGRTQIGSIAPSGNLIEVKCLDQACELVPNALAIGEEGSLWFAAHQFYPHDGGGGAGLEEDAEERREAGIVGLFAR